MDYPLGVTGAILKKANLDVLIPILMDYPLGVKGYGRVKLYDPVLIPILMDYPLGALCKNEGMEPLCLNPYSNGLPSRGYGNVVQ